jgi:hypothetical protein
MNGATDTDATLTANWEELLKRIREQKQYGSNYNIYLTDGRTADYYGYANAVLMETMRPRLVQALQTWHSSSLGRWSFEIGNKFFETMNENEQRRFLLVVVALPQLHSLKIGVTADDCTTTEKPAITISTSALLDALPHLHSRVDHLALRNVALSNESDVQALSNIIIGKRETLLDVHLTGIECPKDATIGFLDPLLYAISRLPGTWCSFSLSARTPPVNSSFITPEALRAMLVEQHRNELSLELCGLGLNDSHCMVIFDALQTIGDEILLTLNLESNPAISNVGYRAILHGMNQRNVVVPTFRLDDKKWESNLNLVSEMNSRHGRLQFMTNGTFSDERRRFEFLERLATPPLRRYDDARQLSFIFYELCENPDMMQNLV